MSDPRISFMFYTPFSDSDSDSDSDRQDYRTLTLTLTLTRQAPFQCATNGYILQYGQSGSMSLF